MDDVVVVDHLGALACPVRPRSLQVHEMRAADEELQAIVIEPDPEPVADQAGGDGVEDLAQGEAAGAGDSDYNLLEVGGASLGKLLQMRAFGLDAGAVAGIVPADDLIDEGAIRHKIVEVPAAAHQQSVADGALEMTVRAFDRAVLVRDALVVAGRHHAVMGAEFLVALREIGFRVGVEIAEGRRQAVAAVILRSPAK